MLIYLFFFVMIVAHVAFYQCDQRLYSSQVLEALATPRVSRIHECVAQVRLAEGLLAESFKHDSLDPLPLLLFNVKRSELFLSYYLSNEINLCIFRSKGLKDLAE